MEEKMRKMDRRRYQYLQWIPPIITIITFLFGALTWFSTMTGIPPRVTNMEERIAELEKSQTALDVKMEMALKAIYEMRGVVMKGKE